MQVQIKKTIKAGNSSAVILPRAWLNKEVRIELIKKQDNQILQEVLQITADYLPLNSIIGIYLVGSYARKEESEDSDIDILIITKDIDKETIQKGIYNILPISYKLLHQKLQQDLFPIGQMLKEAKPLLNSDYLESIKIKVTKKNVKWYLDTTKEKLNLIENYLTQNKNKKYLEDKITYTLILRIRTLEIIKKLIQNKPYSKKEFTKMLNKISGNKNAYESYVSIKNKKKDKKQTTIKGAEKLYNYLKKDLQKVKKMIK